MSRFNKYIDEKMCDGSGKKKRKRKGKEEIQEALRMIDEALTMKGGTKWNAKLIGSLFKKTEKMMDSVDRWFVNNKGINQMIKALDSIKGKPEFGKVLPIGELRGAMKHLEDKALDFYDAYNDAEDAYIKATQWGEKFSDIKGRNRQKKDK